MDVLVKYPDMKGEYENEVEEGSRNQYGKRTEDQEASEYVS